MKIGVVHTKCSVCGCAEAVEQGLRALGHEPLLVDSEEIELRSRELADECAWVIDHTDTFRGHGLLRSVVRALLEARGARVVGSDSRACFLADDKQAAKARLGAAGIPTVPGVTISSPASHLPTWLVPPLVVKPAFEHMSRGLSVVRTEAAACDHANELLRRTGQPVLVEKFVPGREIGVCVLEGLAGPEVLPLVEWRLTHGENGFLAWDFKHLPVAEDRVDLVPAELPDPVGDDIRSLAVAAFRALGLRDYARFDVRLSAEGTAYFLETNVTPSLELSEALAASGRWAGLDYPSLLGRLLGAAAARGKDSGNEDERIRRVELPTGPLELLLPRFVHRPPPSTLELARLLDVRPGETVLDLGCGSGLLSLAAARLGAARVVAVDLDPAALEATAANARRNGLSDRIVPRAGAWYEALEGSGERFDVIVATPPQTPGPRPLGPRYGGTDGTRHLRAVIEGATRFLEPERGRLWLLSLSLAHPAETERLLGARFGEVARKGTSDRPFNPSEYDQLQEGLFDYLLTLRQEGRSELWERGEKGWAFENRYYRAAHPISGLPV